MTTAPAKKSVPIATTLVGMMGSATAAAFLVALAQVEGTVHVGYLDIAGIPTKCTGDTIDVTVGKAYSNAECAASLLRQATLHIADVKRCTPKISGKQMLAAGLLAYNIGGPNYCASSAARYFNAGDYRAACGWFAPWNKITKNGKKVVVKGLVNRRAFETAICLTGVPA